MDALLHPSLLEAYRFLGAAAVVFVAAVVFYKRIQKEGLKKQDRS